MKLSKLKKKYPTADAFYYGFLESEKGTLRWSEVVGDDPADDTDYILEGMQYWIQDLVDDTDMDAADEWFETMEPELFESVYAGLT